MAFLTAVNIEENFWELNSEIKYLQPFKKFYESEVSKKKLYTSRIMWAIYLYCDPDSRFARMSEEERIKEITDNYLGEDTHIDEMWEELVEAYKDKILTKLQKSYNRLLKKLEERDNFIAKTLYNEKNAKMLDSMFANSSTIYQQLQAIANELETEKKSGTIKGGRKESLSERGII